MSRVWKPLSTPSLVGRTPRRSAAAEGRRLERLVRPPHRCHVPPYRRIDVPLGVAVTDMQHEKALQVVLVEVRVQHKEERHVLDDLVNDLLRKEIAIPETPKAPRLGKLRLALSPFSR